MTAKEFETLVAEWAGKLEEETATEDELTRLEQRIYHAPWEYDEKGNLRRKK